jgi:8-oxo-dGTP pyrophosphatase MutT (NUDIX family)
MSPGRVAIPRGWGEWAREYAKGGLSPAVPRDAATVVLVRQAPDVEAFLLRRTRALEFAPGVCVFPGGSVDESDADPAIGWAGPSPAEFAGRLGTSPERARALVCAAVRETFEEAGILLAGPSATTLPGSGGVLDPVPGPALASALGPARRALLDGSASLGEVLGRLGLVVRADLLTPWARWVTPVVSPRRFDTWFFVAALPPGQTATVGLAGAGPGQAESESGDWLRPSAALEAARAGRIVLLPPTAVTLGELAGHRDVAGLLAARRAISPLMPEVTVDDEQAWLAMPAGVNYPL